MPPKKTRQIATDVAAGVVTPAPGLRAQPTTPGIVVPAPSTPALTSPRSKGDKRPLLEEEREDEHEEKKVDQSTSPRRAHEKRVIEVSDDEDEKKACVEVPRTPEVPMESAPTETSTQASPTSSGPLYPPHFAGVNVVEAHGDEEVGVDYIPEDVMEEEIWAMEVKKEMIHLRSVKKSWNIWIPWQRTKRSTGCWRFQPWWKLEQRRWKQAVDTSFPQRKSCAGSIDLIKAGGFVEPD